jgi:hypothetical protein
LQVLDQFLHHPIDSSDELMEAYTVGHRLVKFLSNILPTHDDYFSEETEESDARNRSLEQLVAVLKYLDQIALLIDKQAHEDYIRSVLMDQDELDEDYNGADGEPREVSILEESYYADDDDEKPIQILQEIQLEGSPSAYDASGKSGTTLALHSSIVQSESLVRNRYISRPLNRTHPNVTTADNNFRAAAREVQREVTPEKRFTDSHVSSKSAQRNSGSGSAPSVTVPKQSPVSPNEPLAPTPLVRSARMRLEHRREKSNFAVSSSGGQRFGMEESDTVKMPVQPLSPGSSLVRDRVRTWPPKPDPPTERSISTSSIRSSSSVDQSFASADTSPKRVDKSHTSVSSGESGRSKLHHSNVSSSSVEESSIQRPDRPSTPLPLEQHAITSPEAVRPLLGETIGDDVSARFKPLTERQIQSARMGHASSFNEHTQLNGRVTWADTQFSTIRTRRVERSGFSSSSCSSREEDMEDDSQRNHRFNSSGIRLFGARQQEASSDHQHLRDAAAAEVLPPSMETNMQNKINATYSVTTTNDWRVGNDEPEALGLRLQTRPKDAMNNTPADKMTLDATSNADAVGSVTARGVDTLVMKLNSSTDSNGFPISPSSDLDPCPQGEGGIEVAFGESAERLSSRETQSKDLAFSVGNAASNDVHPASRQGADVSFACVDFGESTRKAMAPIEVGERVNAHNGGIAAGSESHVEGIRRANQESPVAEKLMVQPWVSTKQEKTTHEKLDVSTDTTGLSSSSRSREEGSSDTLECTGDNRVLFASPGKVPIENQWERSSSYAPSVDDWTADDNVFVKPIEKVTSMSVDSMGFPISAEEFVAIPETKGAVSTINGSVASAFDDVSSKSFVVRSSGVVSYATPQSLVVGDSFDFNVSSPGWADAWETAEYDKTLTRSSALNVAAVEQIQTASAATPLSQDSMVRFWAAKGEYPRSSDQTSAHARGDAGLPEEVPSPERALPAAIRSSSHSRSPTHSTAEARATDKDLLPATIESPLFVKGEVSSYRSESNAEQRLKVGVQPEQVLGEARSIPRALESTLASDLELIQKRGVKPEERSDRRNRGNKMLCRKQKEVGVIGLAGDRRLPNEFDSLDEASLLLVKNENSRTHHFKSCVRCLID